jgi:hypothetical protein
MKVMGDLLPLEVVDTEYPALIILHNLGEEKTEGTQAHLPRGQRLCAFLPCIALPHPSFVQLTSPRPLPNGRSRMLILRPRAVAAILRGLSRYTDTHETRVREGTLHQVCSLCPRAIRPDTGPSWLLLSRYLSPQLISTKGMPRIAVERR